MEILRIILGILFLLIGFFGNFLPILPGPPISYLALIMIQIINQSYSNKFLIFMAILFVIITGIDYIIPIIGTKKMGGTKRGIKGSTVGLIVGIIFLPLLGITIGPFGLIGILGFPFLGAYIGEILYQEKKKQKKNKNKALKSAFGTFLGFISGVLLKFTYTVIVAIYFFPEVFKIIKNMF